MDKKIKLELECTLKDQTSLIKELKHQNLRVHSAPFQVKEGFGELILNTFTVIGGIAGMVYLAEVLSRFISVKNPKKVKVNGKEIKPGTSQKEIEELLLGGKEK